MALPAAVAPARLPAVVPRANVEVLDDWSDDHGDGDGALRLARKSGELEALASSR